MEAFAGCSSLTNINIPQTVTKIDNKAYSGCTGLTNIVIQGNSELGMYDLVFENCTGLESVEVPNPLGGIQSDTFNGCTALTQITMGYKVEECDYAEWAPWGAPNMTAADVTWDT